MGKYGAHFREFATTTTAKTALTMVPASTNILCEVVEAIMTGAGATAPTDVQHEARLAKTTVATAGTATTVTAEPMDDAANAARTITKTNYSAEGTVVRSVFPVVFGFNQRGGMRWAVPRGEGVFVYQPLTNKGLAFLVISSVAGAVSGSATFWEP